MTIYSGKVTKKTSKVDDTLLFSVFSGVILALLIWVSMVRNDIQTEVKEIHNTLDIIEKTLEQDGVKLDNINGHIKVICYVGQKQIECP